MRLAIDCQTANNSRANADKTLLTNFKKVYKIIYLYYVKISVDANIIRHTFLYIHLFALLCGGLEQLVKYLGTGKVEMKLYLRFSKKKALVWWKLSKSHEIEEYEKNLSRRY